LYASNFTVTRIDPPVVGSGVGVGVGGGGVGVGVTGGGAGSVLFDPTMASKARNATNARNPNSRVSFMAFLGSESAPVDVPSTIAGALLFLFLCRVERAYIRAYYLDLGASRRTIPLDSTIRTFSAGRLKDTKQRNSHDYT
jgi:hypothetical protein